ncbi:unnamed protein product [Mytilus coruscus]|uniref:C2H2-type domain-containing protein n=1 Tax=Mytilus coruscus TaxID=42192 RepID=A0A6J8DCZ7_MYTCO|nr:unnamed protein product [Mytilus coruscus]
MAYRSSVHDSTKFSPCKLMLGQEIELPIDLIYGPHPQNEEFSDDTHAINEHMIQITQNMWKMMFICRHCGAEYLSREKLMRHVRNKHPKTTVECHYCSYKVSSSLAFRMKEHEKMRHSEQIKTAEKRIKENTSKLRPNPTFIIPVSPMKRAPLETFAI